MKHNCECMSPGCPRTPHRKRGAQPQSRTPIFTTDVAKHPTGSAAHRFTAAQPHLQLMQKPSHPILIDFPLYRCIFDYLESNIISRLTIIGVSILIIDSLNVNL